MREEQGSGLSLYHIECGMQGFFYEFIDMRVLKQSLANTSSSLQLSLLLK